MKHLYLLLISALLFASCNKKDAAPPPAESTPKNAPAAASGHASGGSLTLITPPSVTGGQVGPMTVTIKPTGHSDPSLDGNETIVAACTWAAAGGQLTIIQSGNTDTSITNLPPGITKIVALKPATDSVTVNSYNINVRINGAWFQNTFSTPLNNGTTSIGLETNTYYNGTLTGGTATYAWVMVGDTTYVRGH